MKTALLIVAVGVALVVASQPAVAHHAGTAYDAEHPITLTGTVTEYQLVTPHSQIHFEVTDAQGKVTKWIALSGPPQRLYRSGWRADTLKPGDKITITGAPSKDGQKYMGASKVIGPNGKPLGAEGE